jgi:mannitol-1-phosphate/altronate dehydrogenase
LGGALLRALPALSKALIRGSTEAGTYPTGAVHFFAGASARGFAAMPAGDTLQYRSMSQHMSAYVSILQSTYVSV